MKKDLKLFVWEHTLKDYSYGMVCVLAHDLEEAWDLIREKQAYALDAMDGDEYRVVEKPEAFICWGGG